MWDQLCRIKLQLRQKMCARTRLRIHVLPAGVNCERGGKSQENSPNGPAVKMQLMAGHTRTEIKQRNI